MNRRWEVVNAKGEVQRTCWTRDGARHEAIMMAPWTERYTYRRKGKDEHREAAGDSDNSDALAERAAEARAELALLKARLDSFGAPTGLKESTADVPILAYKVANLVWLPNSGPRFSGINHGSYAPDEEASCRDGSYHQRLAYSYGGRSASLEPHGPIPSVRCSCGFYACTDLEALDGGACVLEVELSGRVIVCENGYRAGHQRVIRCHVRGCHYCGASPATASFEASAELRLLCEQHASTEPSVSVAELSSLLGVPVDIDKAVHA